MNLDGKCLLITGALTHRSIAFSVAEQAQLAGAEVVLTGFGRGKRLTERAAKRLPEPAEVLELDVNSPDDLRGLREDLENRWERVDGVLHAIAFASDDALGGRFLETPAESAAAAFTTSAFSLKRSRRSAPFMERAPASWGSTSTPPSPGPPTTGWACPRPRWKPWPATWPAISGPTASG